MQSSSESSRIWPRSHKALLLADVALHDLVDSLLCRMGRIEVDAIAGSRVDCMRQPLQKLLQEGVDGCNGHTVVILNQYREKFGCLAVDILVGNRIIVRLAEIGFLHEALHERQERRLIGSHTRI